MIVYSHTNVETTPCRCSMLSQDMVKVPTHLKSHVCTFGIGLIFMKIAINVETTWIQRAVKLMTGHYRPEYKS